MKAYSEYQDSQIEWLEKVPTHWDVISIKGLFQRIKRTNFPKAELLSVYRDFGVIPKSSRDDNNNKESDDLTPYQLVKVNDLVMNKMKAWQGSIAISEYEGIVSPAYYVYSPRASSGDKIYPKYIHYLLRNPMYITQYMSRSKGIRVNQWDLDAEAFEKIEVLLPPKSEQKQIYSFLDKETARIDTLIEEKQNFIKLLEEKRQALISHVVTKGLDDSVEMKDSVVESIGEIPANWKIEKIKHSLRSVESGTSVNSESTPANDGKYGVLKTSCVSNGYFAPEENKQVINDDMSRVSCPVKANRLIVSRMNTPELVGASGYTDKSYPKLFLPDRLWQLEFSERVNTKYIFYWAQTASYRDQIKSVCVGTSSSMQNLSQDDFKNFKLPIPSKPTQDLIVEHIDKSNELINRLKLETLNSVALLRERRSALISAAVTGKIDVREEA